MLHRDQTSRCSAWSSWVNSRWHTLANPELKPDCFIGYSSTPINNDSIAWHKSINLNPQEQNAKEIHPCQIHDLISEEMPVKKPYKLFSVLNPRQPEAVSEIGLSYCWSTCTSVRDLVTVSMLLILELKLKLHSSVSTPTLNAIIPR